MLSTSFSGLDFYTTAINKLISHWQKVLTIMVPILIKKDVFEPSYNDLKFNLISGISKWWSVGKPGLLLVFVKHMR